MELSEIEQVGEAEQYHLKALFILHEVQANKQVYGSNSALSGATPANVDLALQYINRSIELIPDNPVYLNLKALLLWEGHGNKEAALPLFERAAQLNPRDIDIQNNLNAVRSSQCVVATAAFGSPLASEVNTLRAWRDKALRKSVLGKLFIATYYIVSPPLARLVRRSNILRAIVRAGLRPVIKYVKPYSRSV
ncbi:MAG: CFI-box-CTERM domain-containing protein [Halomonas sp.]|uniref:CFI-box-CTERM domain-containing protein n=1 Tax=Halomonas sp. TaxID=1486246 RepID=UPI003F92F1BC